MKNAFLLTITPTYLTALVGTDVFARDMTNLTVADGTVTATFEAGNEGDGHVLYYVWSTDGIDKGSDLFAWPNAFRVDRVADDATSYEFTLPTEAFLTGQYACRAFLATSEKKYDYFLLVVFMCPIQYQIAHIAVNPVQCLRSYSLRKNS